MPDAAVQDRRTLLQRSVAGALLCAALGGAVGYAVADARGGSYELVGEVYSTELQMGFRGPDGQAMEVPLDVDWTAPPDRFVSGSRPACLPPTDQTIRGIRVTAVDVVVAGRGYSQVVAVHCDGAGGDD